MNAYTYFSLIVAGVLVWLLVGYFTARAVEAFSGEQMTNFFDDQAPKNDSWPGVGFCTLLGGISLLFWLAVYLGYLLGIVGRKVGAFLRF